MAAFLKATKETADKLKQNFGKVLPGRLMGLVGADVNKVVHGDPSL